MAIDSSLEKPPAPSETRFEDRFASPDTGILVLDEDGYIDDVNTFLSGLLLYSPKELRGKPLWELGGSPIDGADRLAVEQLHRQGYLRCTDLPLKSKDGMWISFEFRRLGHLPNNGDLIECQFHELELIESAQASPRAAAEQYHRRIVYGRRFEEIIHRELELTRSEGQALSLLSIGIDRIDRDNNEHASSPALALRGLAHACARLLRSTDVVGRIDDASFVALLPRTATQGALCAAERLRTAIAAIHAPVSHGHRRITLSIGVVSTRTGRITYSGLRSRADAKRDDARTSGGNRVNA